MRDKGTGLPFINTQVIQLPELKCITSNVSTITHEPQTQGIYMSMNLPIKLHLQTSCLTVSL